jgi:hypothetical protein
MISWTIFKWVYIQWLTGPKYRKILQICRSLAESLALLGNLLSGDSKQCHTKYVKYVSILKIIFFKNFAVSRRSPSMNRTFTKLGVKVRVFLTDGIFGHEYFKSIKTWLTFRLYIFNRIQRLFQALKELGRQIISVANYNFVKILSKLPKYPKIP